MLRLFIFGLGYAAGHVARRFARAGWETVATGSEGDIAFDDAGTVRMALADASHVLSSVPPGGEALDPVLDAYGDALSGKWLGYLSSTGVYGDTQGAWVDESAALVGSGGTGRRTARSEADLAWQARGAHVFRLPGIYGPGRSMLDRVREGRANRIDLPGQVFSRVHVEDIAEGVFAALAAAPGVWNLADDLPASQNLVVEEACRLLDLPLPPMRALSTAPLSPQARAFYSENRRVANGKARRVLGWKLRFPTYREGLRALIAPR